MGLRTRGVCMPRAPANQNSVRGALAGAGEIRELLDQLSWRSGRMPIDRSGDVVGLCKLWLHAKCRRGNGLFIHARMAPQF